MTRILASFVTLTAMAIAAVAAWDRGSDLIDRVLLVSLAIGIVAAVHFLPALSRGFLTWLLWFACLLCAVYGHLTFFTYAAQRAGDIRADSSRQVLSVKLQIQTNRDALLSIHARPVTTVAALLSKANSERRREALLLELMEAQRAARLNDELVRLTATVTDLEVLAAADPVIVKLASVSGHSESSISLATSVVFSIILELVGAMLWSLALRRTDEVAMMTVSVSPTAEPTIDPVKEVRDAIASGDCKPTVAGIRAFLGCGQARAMTLRRAL